MDGMGGADKNLEELQGWTRGGAGAQKSLPRNGAQGWEERERRRESVRQGRRTRAWNRLDQRCGFLSK